MSRKFVLLLGLFTFLHANILSAPEITKQARSVLVKLTAYDPCRLCTGRWYKFHKTTIGKDPRILDGVAADFRLLPPGTMVFIPDIGIRKVDDNGGVMRQSTKKQICQLDIRMKTHLKAEKFGFRCSERIYILP